MNQLLRREPLTIMSRDGEVVNYYYTIEAALAEPTNDLSTVEIAEALERHGAAIPIRTLSRWRADQ